MSINKKLYYQKFYLKNELQKFVKYIWVMKSSEMKSEQDLLIPDGYHEIIFVKKGAYQKQFLDGKRNSTIINKSCVIGIQTKSVLANRIDNCHLIGLKLTPLGAYNLFGNLLKSILDSNKLISEFGVKWLEDLDHSIREYEDENGIIELLTKTFLNQIKNLEKNQENDLASYFLSSILSVNGQISIQELAQYHCLSIRHFQRKFKTFFGITPKRFLNIIRFKHFYKSSILKEKPNLNYLDYGYYDQMHFIKDFKKHLGINPSNSSNEAFLQKNKIAQLSL